MSTILDEGRDMRKEVYHAPIQDPTSWVDHDSILLGKMEFVTTSTAKNVEKFHTGTLPRRT